MNAVYAALICVMGAIISSVVRQNRPELAMGVAIAAGTAAIAVCLPEISAVISAVRALGADSGIGGGAISIMLRGAGIAIIAEFASQVCADAGETSLAGRIELGARLALLAMATPLLSDVLASVYSLLSY